MKKARQWLFVVVSILIFSVCMMSACAGQTGQEEEEEDYPVVGIWHASTSWHEITHSNIGGLSHDFDDLYQLDIYFDFREDGTLRNKRTLSMNGIEWKDDFTDWVILNITWTVSGNVITLSSGKQYVIVDDQFDDMYTGNKILHYIKEN